MAEWLNNNIFDNLNAKQEELSKKNLPDIINDSTVKEIEKLMQQETEALIMLAKMEEARSQSAEEFLSKLKINHQEAINRIKALHTEAQKLSGNISTNTRKKIGKVDDSELKGIGATVGASGPLKKPIKISAKDNKEKYINSRFEAAIAGTKQGFQVFESKLDLAISDAIARKTKEAKEALEKLEVEKGIEELARLYPGRKSKPEVKPPTKPEVKPPSTQPNVPIVSGPPKPLKPVVPTQSETNQTIQGPTADIPKAPPDWTQKALKKKDLTTIINEYSVTELEAMMRQETEALILLDKMDKARSTDKEKFLAGLKDKSQKTRDKLNTLVKGARNLPKVVSPSAQRNIAKVDDMEIASITGSEGTQIKPDGTQETIKISQKQNQAKYIGAKFEKSILSTQLAFTDFANKIDESLVEAIELKNNLTTEELKRLSRNRKFNAKTNFATVFSEELDMVKGVLGPERTEILGGNINRVLKDADPAFSTVYASEKHHTPEFRKDYGLVNHNRAMMREAVEARQDPKNKNHGIFASMSMDEFEALIMSIVIHDIDKYRVVEDGKTKYNPDHGLTAWSSLGADTREFISREHGEEMAQRIKNADTAHMRRKGETSADPYTRQERASILNDRIASGLGAADHAAANNWDERAKGFNMEPVLAGLGKRIITPDTTSAAAHSDIIALSDLNEAAQREAIGMARKNKNVSTIGGANVQAKKMVFDEWVKTMSLEKGQLPRDSKNTLAAFNLEHYPETGEAYDPIVELLKQDGKIGNLFGNAVTGSFNPKEFFGEGTISNADNIDEIRKKFGTFMGMANTSSMTPFNVIDELLASADNANQLKTTELLSSRAIHPDIIRTQAMNPDFLGNVSNELMSWGSPDMNIIGQKIQQLKLRLDQALKIEMEKYLDESGENVVGFIQGINTMAGDSRATLDRASERLVSDDVRQRAARDARINSVPTSTRRVGGTDALVTAFEETMGNNTITTMRDELKVLSDLTKVKKRLSDIERDRFTTERESFRLAQERLRLEAMERLTPNERVSGLRNEMEQMRIQNIERNNSLRLWNEEEARRREQARLRQTETQNEQREMRNRAGYVPGTRAAGSRGGGGRGGGPPVVETRNIFEESNRTSREMMYDMKNMFFGVAGPLLQVSSIVGIVNRAVATMTEVELAMINVARVFDGTEADLLRLNDAMAKTALEFGDSLQNVGKIYEEWAKTGKKAFEEINQLTRVTELAINTSNITNVEEAVKFLNSAIQQMGLNFSNAETLLDSWNKTADSFPADTKDYAEAYERSASYAKNMGLDIHDLNAAVSILIERTGRSGSEVGTSLRMLFSNIFRPKSIAVLREMGIEAHKLGLEGQILTDQYRPFEEVMTDINKKFSQFSAADSSAYKVKLSSALGEARRRNDAIALIEGWSSFESIRDLSANESAGYSASKNEETMKSLHKQAQQLQAAFASVALTLGNAGLVDLFKLMTGEAMNFIIAINKLNPTLKNLVVIGLTLEAALLAIHKGSQMLFGSKLGIFGNLGIAIQGLLGRMGGTGPVFGGTQGLFESTVDRAANSPELMAMLPIETERRAAIGNLLRQETMFRSLNTQMMVQEAATRGAMIGPITAEQHAIQQANAARVVEANTIRAANVTRSAMIAATNLFVIALALSVYWLIRRNKIHKEYMDTVLRESQESQKKLAEMDGLIAKHKELEQQINSITASQKKATAAFDSGADSFGELKDPAVSAKVYTEQLNTAQTELIDVQKEMARVMPVTTSHIDDQGVQISGNIEKVEALTESYRKNALAHARILYAEYKEESPDAKKTLEAATKRRDEIMKNLDDLGTGKIDIYTEFDPTSGMFGQTISYDRDKAMNKLNDDLVEAQKKVDEATENIEKLISGRDYYFDIQFKVPPMSTEDKEMMDNLTTQTNTIRGGISELDDSFARDYETIDKALRTISKSNDRKSAPAQSAYKILAGIVPKIKEIGELGTSTESKLLGTSMETLGELAKQYLEAIRDGRVDFLEEERKKTVGYLEQVKIRLSAWAAERDILANQNRDTGDIVGGDRYLDTRVGRNRANRLKDLENNVAAANKEISSTEDTLRDLDLAILAAYEVNTGDIGSAAGGGSGAATDQYKKLDRVLKDVDIGLKLVENDLKLLDALWKDHSKDVEYLTDRKALLANQEIEVGKAIATTSALMRGLNADSDSDKIMELSSRLFDLRTQLIGVNQEAEQLTRSLYENEMGSFDKDLKAINTVFEIQSAGIREGAESLDYAILKVREYDRSLPILVSKQARANEEIARATAEIEALGIAWHKTQNQGERDRFHAKADGLRNYIETLKTGLTDIQKSMIELDKNAINFVAQVLKSGYQRSLDDMTKRIDKQTKTLTKAHNIRMKELQDELDLLSRQWADDDYAENIENLNTEIDKLRGQISEISLDTSQTAAKQRADLQEQLNGKLDELEKAQTQRSRDEQEERIQDEIDAATERHEEQLESMEEEKERWTEHYQELINKSEDYGRGILDAYQQNHFNLIDFLKAVVPEYSLLGEEAMAAYNRGLNLQILQPDGSTSSYTPKLAHQYNMSGAHYTEMLANGERWKELDKMEGHKRPVTNTEMIRLNQRNMHLRSLYGMPAGSYPSFHKGGIKAEEGFALIKRREMVLPEKYTNVMDILASIVRMPSASTYGQGVNPNGDTIVGIDKVINIENANFYDEMDYEALEVQAARSFKRELFKVGIKSR